jgi:hypothetical protein
LFEKCGIHLIETKKCKLVFFVPYLLKQFVAEYKANFIEQDLSRLLTSVESNLEALELKRALGALNCVLKHLDVIKQKLVNGELKNFVFT